MLPLFFSLPVTMTGLYFSWMHFYADYIYWPYWGHSYSFQVLNIFAFHVQHLLDTFPWVAPPHTFRLNCMHRWALHLIFIFSIHLLCMRPWALPDSPEHTKNNILRSHLSEILSCLCLFKLISLNFSETNYFLLALASVLYPNPLSISL